MGRKSSSIDYDRLCHAMRRSRLALRRFRTERKDMVRQYVGQHWSEEGTAERVYVNLLSLYVRIVSRQLIAKNPRVMLSTFDRGVKPTVAACQKWANEQMGRMDLANTLRRIVVDALFSIGIAKVSLLSPAESAAIGFEIGAGQAYCEPVSLDDFVFDIHARDFHECSFIGHRYRVPLELVRESKLYSKDRKQLSPSRDPIFNIEGDERLNVMGRSVYTGESQEFEDYVDLWEIYLPRHKLVCTLADDQMTGPALGPSLDPLRVQPWVGPNCGPYHILGFGTVPDNAMPKAPLQDLLDLHDAANRAYRKLIRASERTKEVTAVQGGAMEDGSRIMQANDGDIIRVDNPERIRQVQTGGIALQQVLAVATATKDLFVYMAGNLDALGGLSAQSKTLGQDKLLTESASGSMQDMQDTTISFVGNVVRSLAWYWWNDPLQIQKTSHSLPGLPNLSVLRKVTPQQRGMQRFEDLGVEVDPYSMAAQTPQTRMAALNQVVTQIVVPMMQLLVQQGIQFDINAYLKKIGQYADMPDLADILTIGDPLAAETLGGQGDTGPKPAQTERTYTRLNAPSQTREASDRNMVTSMMGVNTGGQNGQSNGIPRQ